MNSIGSTIQKRRQELGLTQKELSLLVGIGINTLLAIERGNGNPSLKKIEKVADALGLELTLVYKK